MPKRKRPSSISKTVLLTHLTTSRKLLQRTLKTAKGFERQKLSKRLKLATEKGDEKTVKRIVREIEALKGLELAAMAEGYFRRWLGKVKGVREGLIERGLQEWLEEVEKGGAREVEKGGAREVREVGGENDEEEQHKGREEEDEAGRRGGETTGGVEKKAALHNVTSNMYNAAVVRECMAKIMSGVHMELGIPIPAPSGQWKDPTKNQDSAVESATPTTRRASQNEETKTAEPQDDAVLEDDSWDGLDSGDEKGRDQQRANGNLEDLDMDEEELSRYDHLIGASSDEESFDEEEHEIQHPSKRSKRSPLDPSISPSPSRSQSPSTSPQPSASRVQTNPSKLLKPSKPPKPPSQAAPQTPLQATRKSLSTFLPTLYGGYISGTSSASSLSDDDNANAKPAIRKNRPGQMARRAIWEKKYGQKANHIKSGKGTVSETGDGWDGRRGAKSSSMGRNRAERRSQSNRRGESGTGSGIPTVRGGRGTGENAVPVDTEVRKRGKGRKDDTGVLHPSWEAKKKAKEKEKGVVGKFQGRKVVFE